jgi:hypothetical protein
MMKSVVAKRMRLNNSSSSYNRGIRTELDKYLAEECEDEVKILTFLLGGKGSPLDFPYYLDWPVMCWPFQSQQLQVNLHLAQVGVY